MSDRKPLMPKATAVWLVENTSLSFEQIAEFCGLHNLEVKAMADGDITLGIRGLDPISSNQLTREEIALAERDTNRRLRLADTKVVVPPVKAKKGPRYTPLSRRHDKPNAILWLVKSHPELKDAQIIRLIGTTKPTIEAIRSRGHWNAQNLVPQDPVTLGICSQVDLDAEVQKAAKRVPSSGALNTSTLLPTEMTTDGPTSAHGLDAAAAADDEPTSGTEAEEDAKVLARLKEISGKRDDA
ncbi:MAG: hypothetical protein RL291_883 [Pseudomonadota bacterium]|jgi:hypothetical protein